MTSLYNSFSSVSVRDPLLDHGQKKEFKGLKKNQICKVLMDFEDTHPLRREALIDDIWPCLKVCRICLGKRKPDFRASLKLCMHLDMDLRTTEVVRTHEVHSCEKSKEI